MVYWHLVIFVKFSRFSFLYFLSHESVSIRHPSPKLQRFHCRPTPSCITPISSGKTTKLPINHTKFANESYDVCRCGHIYRNGPKRAGLNTASDKLCVHSCNGWLCKICCFFLVLLRRKTETKGVLCVSFETALVHYFRSHFL